MGTIKDIVMNDINDSKNEENNKYQEALSKYDCTLNDEQVAAEVKQLLAEKLPQNDNLDVKKFLFGSIELTTLKNTDNDESVMAFTEKVNRFDNDYTQLPHVATIGDRKSTRLNSSHANT